MPQSEIEIRSRAELRSLLIEDGSLEAAIVASAPYETEEELCDRFLRARGYSVEKAFKMLKADLEWRERNGINSYRTCSAESVLGCAPEILHKALPHGFIGRDREGRSVIYKAFGAFHVTKMPVDAEHCVAYDTWMTERCVEMLGPSEDSFVVIIDLKGIGWSNMQRPNLKYCRLLADAGAPHYPERMGKTLIINAPSIFTWAFGVISSWLDERTRSKVSLLGGPSSFMPVLEKVLDPRILPVSLGGETELNGCLSFCEGKSMEVKGREVPIASAIGGHGFGMEGEGETEGGGPHSLLGCSDSFDIDCPQRGSEPSGSSDVCSRGGGHAPEEKKEKGVEASYSGLREELRPEVMGS
uniref:CRAL-TRIO domain-containing protein n=1 Tax=Chromera velia CCMP2878 TaxID=1169474 RepID=A0A0G4G946_9ALVE|eukprot:Cvel_595.t1-p1 / transcript=Cvel_595.t1 / gene=Cvel_595 / organism=Chromera_velia_CCMP2878 / gene_product=Protein real-time, putative / transcript_product=Protein real-time, putative / location=Cvel_scaffold18:137845-138909(-) / protein_length=355 / sequence_SO=supercontig / SO=protein_coding / is_pseudo=false